MSKQKLTAKQEAFVNKYVECGNASEAYRVAYEAQNMKPDTIKVKACELLKNGNIAVTVMELQDAARERTLVTVEKQTARLQALSVKAETFDTAPGISAAINAEKEVNKLNGLVTEKRSVAGSIGTAALPWDEMYKITSDMTVQEAADAYEKTRKNGR